MFFRLAGCHRGIRLNIPKPIRTVVNNGIKLPVYAQEVDRLMSLLAPLRINTSIIDFRLPIREKDKKTVDIIWNDYQLKAENPIVAFAMVLNFLPSVWKLSVFRRLLVYWRKILALKFCLLAGQVKEVLEKKL
jgi:hypothetical protein